MSRAPIAVVQDDLAAHPAVQAWDGDAPESIQILRDLRTAAVYRLIGAGPGGTGVIAKRSPRAAAAAELRVYEHILPHLPVSAPRYYGSRPGTDADVWLFLEDVGTQRYSDTDATHLALAARWVAHMHGAAAAVAATRELPDGGPGRYLEHLRTARAAITDRCSGPNLSSDDLKALGATVKLLDVIESRWADIERSCESFPETLVHGDFRPKNVYLRQLGSSLACYPIDWETAGWGVPAADLTRIDVMAYWMAARRQRPALEFATVQRLLEVGRMFCNVAAIDWETVTLRSESRQVVTRPLASLRVLVARLTAAARATGALP